MNFEVRVRKMGSLAVEVTFLAAERALIGWNGILAQNRHSQIRAVPVL